MTFETFSQCDEKWWPDQQKERQKQTQRQWRQHIHLENALKERYLRIVTFEIFAQSDEKTWPDQQKDINENKDNVKDNDKNI